MARKPKAARSVDLDEMDETVVIDEPEIPEDDEVSNAMDVPLFSGAGFANNRAIAKLRLVKLDNPGAGYKGEIPTTSTLETIGQLFGDGVYNIEAVNARGFRLRVLENQRISLGLGPNDGSHPAPAAVSGPSTTDLDRVERLARQAAAESVQQAAAHTRLVSETTQAAAAREREFMQGANAQTQQFFASILAAMTQGHQQQMTMMQTSHTHMMEMMLALRADNGSGGDSTERMLGLFSQGLTLGRSLDQPDEQPFWREILQGGASLLTSARQGQLAAGMPRKLGKGSNGATKLKRIVAAMRKRGIDPDQLLSMLEGGENRPAATEPDSDPEESEDEPSGPIFTRGGDTDSDTE